MTTYRSAWDAIEDTPEQAGNLKLRGVLMMAIEHYLTSQEGTPAEKAERLNLTRPRLNDLMQGRIQKFSLASLVSIASRAGLIDCPD